MNWIAEIYKQKFGRQLKLVQIGVSGDILVPVKFAISKLVKQLIAPVRVCLRLQYEFRSFTKTFVYEILQTSVE